MGQVVGYDPARLRVLHERAAAVAAHLGAARVADPAAAGAVRTAVAVRTGVEQRWLPALGRIMASDALLSWRTTVPSTMSPARPPGGWFDDLEGHHGAALGAALAARARHLSIGDYGELEQALEATLGDTAAMDAFVNELGPADLLDLVSDLIHAAPTTRADELAPALRAAFVAAAPALLPSFGSALVRHAAEARGRRPDDNAAGAALGYLYNGEALPTELLVATTQTLREVEVTAARRRGQDAAEGDGAVLWATGWPPSSASPLVAELRPDPGAPYLADMSAAYDPAYAILRQLARDGAAGRRLFTERSTARYFFAQRPVTEDHGRAITAAAAAAAATDGVVPPADAATVRAAMLVASAFVNDFGPAHAGALLGRSDVDVSVAVASLLGRHLQSVQLTVTPPTGRGADPEAVGVVSSQHEVLGPDGPRLRAQFDPTALDAVMDLAANTPAGGVTLRDYLTTFQAEVAAVGAGRIARGEIPAGHVDRFLAEAMEDAGRLEGVFAAHVGHRAERHGRDKDRELSFWVDGLGATVELGAGAYAGPVTSAVIGQAVDPLTDGFLQRFATHEARAAVAAESLAQDATDRLLYLWDRQLVDQHVLTPELPARLVVGGRLPAFDGLGARIADVRANDPDPDHATYDLRAFFNAVDVAAGRDGLGVDDGALYDAVKTAQLRIYQQLD